MAGPMFATDKTDVATDAAQLVHCMDEQAAIFKQWFQTEDDKERALLARDRMALEAIVTTQERLLAALHSLQDAFVARLERLASACGLSRLESAMNGAKAGDGAESGIAQMWERVTLNLPEQTAQQMLAARERLTDCAGRVRERSRQNQQLLQQAAAHNAVILEAFAGPAQETVTYGAPAQAERATPGRSSLSSTRRLVDWQA